MKRSVLVFLLLMLMLLMNVTQASITYADEPVAINHLFFNGETFYANSDQQIQLFWFWAATTRGQVNVLQNHSEQTHVITEVSDSANPLLYIGPEEADLYWEPTLTAPPIALGLDCPAPTINGAFWRYTHDPLPAGTYTVEGNITFTNPVNDGYHTCTWLDTGEPASPTPALYAPQEWDFAVTLIVTEP